MADRSDVEASPRTAWWNIRQSWWILLTLLPIGLGAWAAFLYVGLRARHRAWLWIAGVYGALLIILLTLFTLSMAWVPLVGGLMAIALWALPFFHAIAITPHYLRELWARQHGVVQGSSPADLYFPGTFVRRAYSVRATHASLLGLMGVVALICLLGAILAGFFLVQGVQGVLATTGHVGVPGTVVARNCATGIYSPCTGTFTPSDPAAGPAVQNVHVAGRPAAGAMESARLVNGTAWPAGWDAAGELGYLLLLPLLALGSLGGAAFRDVRRRVLTRPQRPGSARN